MDSELLVFQATEQFRIRTEGQPFQISFAES